PYTIQRTTMPYRVINGIRLRYELWGEGKTPLVLLHGLGSSADDWMLQLPAFAPHFLCVLPDLRGHGLSDKPNGRYSVALFADDVADLLTELELAPAHILGLSLGGLVAQQLAIDHGAMVRSLVLINTFPGLWPPPLAALSTLMRRRSILGAQGMAETAERVAGDLFPNAHLDVLRNLTRQRLAANDADAYRRAALAVLRFWPGRKLKRITQPTLILAGENDRVVPALYQERLRRRLPHAQFVSIPHSGHASNIDQPEAVNAAVLNFLLALERDEHGRT
ncbi:MAG: alpha/beta hydrolase, partial [Anaerolineae bacterium]|nr:alpha/beta hydrolase [Anaerolineae bacterium]